MDRISRLIQDIQLLCGGLDEKRRKKGDIGKKNKKSDTYIVYQDSEMKIQFYKGDYKYKHPPHVHVFMNKGGWEEVGTFEITKDVPTSPDEIKNVKIHGKKRILSPEYKQKVLSWIKKGEGEPGRVWSVMVAQWNMENPKALVKLFQFYIGIALTIQDHPEIDLVISGWSSNCFRPRSNCSSKASRSAKTLLVNHFSRSSSHIFSTGFNSGE